MWQDYVMRFVVFGMISAVVLNMMPKEVYKKYIKIVMGFMLMVILLNPIASLMASEYRFSEIFAGWYDDICHVERLPDFSKTEETYQTLLRGLYEEKVEEQGEDAWLTTEETDILWQSGQNTESR